jgi:hypothetical protein
VKTGASVQTGRQAMRRVGWPAVRVTSERRSGARRAAGQVCEGEGSCTSRQRCSWARRRESPVSTGYHRGWMSIQSSRACLVSAAMAAQRGTRLHLHVRRAGSGCVVFAQRSSHWRWTQQSRALLHLYLYPPAACRSPRAPLRPLCPLHSCAQPPTHPGRHHQCLSCRRGHCERWRGSTPVLSS